MRGFFIILSFSIVVMLSNASCTALKVTDPGNPQFDVSKFDFQDYDGSNFSKIINELFPLGSDEEYIEKVLVEYGGANVNQEMKSYLGEVSYSKVVTRGYSCLYFVKAIFDARNKLKDKLVTNFGCDAL